MHELGCDVKLSGHVWVRTGDNGHMGLEGHPGQERGQ